MKNIFLGLSLIFGLMLFSSCNDDPTSIGSDLIPGSDDIIFKSIDSRTDTVAQSASSFIKKVNLGVSETLILGKNSYAESSVFLRFDITVDDSILAYFQNNTGSVAHSWIDVRPTYYLGDKSETLDFEGYQIKNEWNPSGFDLDSLALLSIDNTNMISNIVTNDSTVTFDISKTYAENWIRKLFNSDIEDNYGIYLKPKQNTNRFIGFDAYSLYGAAYQPVLHIEISKPNNLPPDTLNYVPYIDTYLTTGDEPVSATGNLSFIQGSLAERSFLYFDLSSVPSNYAVNSARLELTLDTTKSYDGTPSSEYISVRRIEDSTAMSLGSDSLTAATLTKDGPIYSGDISTFVQNWVKNGNNQGMMLQLYDEANSVARVAFYNGREHDINLRPRLKIIFMQKK